MRLQVKLLFIVAPCGILSLILIYLFTNAGLYERASRQTLTEMNLALDIAQRQIREFVSSAETTVSALAETSELPEYSSFRTLNGNDSIRQHQIHEYLRQLKRKHPEYVSLRLMRSDGSVLPLITRGASMNSDQVSLTPALAPRDERQGSEHLQTAGSLHAIQITSLHAHAVARQSYLRIRQLLPYSQAATPYRGNADSSAHTVSRQLDSYLVLTVDLALLAEKISFEIGSEKIQWSLLDADGGVILHSAKGHIGSIDTELLQLEKSRFTAGVPSHASYRKVPMLVSRATVVNDASLVVLLPDSTVRKSIVQFSNQLAIITAVSTFMGIATFFTLLRFLVMRPLISLRQLAMSIGLNDQEGTGNCMDMKRQDEIGDLSRAFKDTSERLQASMDEIRNSHAQIEVLAYRDTLTGLANRRLFNQVAEQRICEAREQGHGLCVLFLDLDDFKRINDTQGHKAGDKLLETVSSRLLDCVEEVVAESVCNHALNNSQSTVARMGGDEFIALLPYSETGNEGEKAASRIIAAMARPIPLNGHEFVVSTSIGIAEYPTHADNVDELIKCADAAMYEAKRLNKNNFRTYGSSIQQALEDRMLLEMDLRQALTNNEFTLVFQPQYSVQNMELVGAEALLRWNHPRRGPVPPEVFIPMAEERDLIGEIGKWVLDGACRQWKIWQTSGVAMNRIAVNVSARQLAFGNIKLIVDEVLKSYDMPASALEIELTESCLIESPIEMYNTLSELRDSGITIAMDDFGTGYSSLSTIASMPVDTVKIDRSFITNITIGSPNEKIVSAILMLADSLKLQVVAEGVERECELNFLRNKQCHIAQGFYLSKPLSSSDMTTLLHERADSQYRQSA